MFENFMTFVQFIGQSCLTFFGFIIVMGMIFWFILNLASVIFNRKPKDFGGVGLSISGKEEDDEND